MTQTSIADLFIAGVGPALLLTGMMAIYSMAVNYDRPRGSYALREIGTAFARSIFALLTPGIILGGIYSGYFTPTESAAVAVFTALIVELLIHRDMSLGDLYDVVGETAKLMGSLFPLLAFATAFNTFMTYQQIPGLLVDLMTGMVESKLAFILATNVILLIVGFIVDIGSAILILSPLLQPLATSPELRHGPGSFRHYDDRQFRDRLSDAALGAQSDCRHGRVPRRLLDHLQSGYPVHHSDADRFGHRDCRAPIVTVSALASGHFLDSSFFASRETFA